MKNGKLQEKKFFLKNDRKKKRIKENRKRKSKMRRKKITPVKHIKILKNSQNSGIKKQTN